MAKKKPKAASQIHLRLDPTEMAAVKADCQEVGGIPVGVNAYAKHATLRFAKLRKLEKLTRRTAESGLDGHEVTARNLLAEAGL